MDLKTWRRAFAVALVLTAAYCLWDNGSLAQSLYYQALCAVGLVGVLVGVRRARPVRVRLWYLLAAGLGCSYLGDTLWDVYEFALHVDPFPSPADALYLSGYGLLAAGAAVLLRGRTPGRDHAGLVDALIVATGGGLLTWVFLVAPAVAASDSTAARALAAAYPLGDLMLVTMVARLFTGPGARTTSFWLVTVGLGILLVPDVAYLLSTTYGDGRTPPWADTGWILSYLLVGAAALHPSMRTMSEPAPDGGTQGMSARLALLTAAALVPSGTVLLEATLGLPTDAVVCACASILVLLLVLLRVRGLMRLLRAQAVQLAALARTDGLTGIANRRTWDHELSRECAHSARTGSVLTVALLDLDHFKAYNDAAGHQAGDRLLVQASAVWGSLLRPGDLLARYGGEEFGVLLHGCGEEEAVALLDALRRATPQGQTVSVGVATAVATTDPAALVARADHALYEAKRTGRDRVRTAPPADAVPAQAVPAQAVPVAVPAAGGEVDAGALAAGPATA